MAEKRTKADKAQRQADKLDKKARHPGPKKKKTHRDDSQAYLETNSPQAQSSSSLT
jgi:hypothetical protein